MILVDAFSYFRFGFLIRFLYTLFSLIYASFSTFTSFNSSFLSFEVQDFRNGQLFNWFFNIEACFLLIRLSFNYCSLSPFRETYNTCTHSCSRWCLWTTIAMLIILLGVFLFKTTQIIHLTLGSFSFPDIFNAVKPISILPPQHVIVFHPLW